MIRFLAIGILIQAATAPAVLLNHYDFSDVLAGGPMGTWSKLLNDLPAQAATNVTEVEFGLPGAGGQIYRVGFELE